MNIRAFFAALNSYFPWITPAVRFLFLFFYSTLADLGSLLFQSPEEQDEEPSQDELFVSDELSSLDKLETYSKSDLILHRFVSFSLSPLQYS